MSTKPVLQFVRDWVLVISMIVGVAGYFAYVNIPALDGTHVVANDIAAVVQPLLIFFMLFLTFCKVDLRSMHLCRWHVWLLLIQCGMFVGLAALEISLPQCGARVVIEGAMLCLICPTATAAAVVTGKLDGSVADITTYTILINLAAAILIPAIVPHVHPVAGMSIMTASLLIMGKVFPLLLLPLVLAMLVRRLLPPLRRLLMRSGDLAFYLWAVSLSLAIAVTTRSVVHSTVDLATQLWLVGVSLFCCVGQFVAGWRIGRRCGDRVTAGQALGQKNTVLAIWMGYTFFTPVTAIAGGFYCIWHNVINSWQLYRHNACR